MTMASKFSRRDLLRVAAASAGSLAMPAWARRRSIEESGFVRIGGIEQWIAIQGQDIANPVIVFLHGGPGDAQSPFLKEFVPWERDFTVVNWDQRGSGKTYGKSGGLATPGMSTPDEAVAQMTEDAIEVVEHACRRLGKRKAVLVGHSWGSMLGLYVARRRPDLLHAFVGTAQLVSWSLSVEALERWAHRQAMKAGDQATLTALSRASSLPVTDIRRFIATGKYRMAPSDLDYLKMEREFMGKPPLPKHGDVADYSAGGAFSVPRLLPAIVSFDSRKLGLQFAAPFFVIQGRNDHVVSVTPAREFVAEVQAPRKAFVEIDGGHFACFTDPAEFVGALRQYVRPIATM
jgi:proline iminopeptidase